MTGTAVGRKPLTRQDIDMGHAASTTAILLDYLCSAG
jgi:hypothetical protein